MSPAPEEGPRPSAGGLELTEEGERLWLAWVLHLRRLLHRDGGFVMHVPGLVSGRLLARSGYAEHFPQNVLRAVPLTDTDGKGDSERPTARSGGEPSPRAGAPELALSPASCLHVYDDLADGALPDGGVQGVVYGPCGRYEGGLWSGSRLSHFTMLEWVALGTAEAIEELAGVVPPSVGRSLEGLGLGLDLVGATDPFFAGERSGPALMQQMTGAKLEWRNPEGTAVGSVNRHGDAYGTRFGIRADGEPAHSMCVAFGIERLVREGLRVWGSTVRDWPEELRGHGSLL